MSSASDTESPFVQDVDDVKSEATEEFVVVDSDVTPGPDSLSVADPSPRKMATIVVGESEEDDDDDEEILQGEDDDFLADYPDDTEAWFFLY